MAKHAIKILKGPRVTEKASMAAEADVYTFEVAPGANKTEIEKAIFEIYKVKPVKVNILRIPKKTVMSRGIKGSKGGGKKALVYLKKGDKIEII